MRNASLGRGIGIAPSSYKSAARACYMPNLTSSLTQGVEPDRIEPKDLAYQFKKNKSEGDEDSQSKEQQFSDRPNPQMMQNYM